MLGPVPTGVPPQEPVNHCHTAPVPRDPPFTVRVFEILLQVLLLNIIIPTGAVETVPTETASELTLLVPHEFPAVTVIFPFCPELPAVTLIDAVPAPPVTDQPAGTVQV